MTDKITLIVRFRLQEAAIDGLQRI
jgi:hypothetical protein